MKIMFPAIDCVALMLAPLGAFGAATESAKTFVSDAIKGDNSEIMLGQLAEQHGGSQGVRALGQTLATDHAKAKDQMMKLAMSLDLAPPAEPKPEARQEYDGLAKLSGNAFDREF